MQRTKGVEKLHNAEQWMAMKRLQEQLGKRQNKTIPKRFSEAAACLPLHVAHICLISC